MCVCVSGLQLLIVGEHELRVVGSLTKDCIEDVPLVERFRTLYLLACQVRCRRPVRCLRDVFLALLMFKCCFTATETVGLLGTGAQDGHVDLHIAHFGLVY